MVLIVGSELVLISFVDEYVFLTDLKAEKFRVRVTYVFFEMRQNLTIILIPNLTSH